MAGALVAAAVAAHASSAPVIVTPGTGPGYTPAALQRLYNAAGVLGRPGTTQGSRIAIILGGEVALEDVDTFRRRFGLPPAPIDVRHVGGAADALADPASTIVLEWVTALAPETPVTAVVGDPWIGLALAITENIAPIVVVPDLSGSGPGPLPISIVVSTVRYEGLEIRVTNDGIVTVS